MTALQSFAMTLFIIAMFCGVWYLIRKIDKVHEDILKIKKYIGVKDGDGPTAN